MKIIVWMLSRMILTRFLCVLLAITLFVLTLEIVAYTKEILALDPNTFLAVGQYMVVRSASFIATFLPMSLLLAMLITMSELSYRNELTALWATGVSPLRLVAMLVPVALVASALHFTMSNQAVPASATVLKSWGIGDYKARNNELTTADPIWMRAGNDILRAARVNQTATKLDDVIIFRRNADGILESQILAKTATLQNGKWTLSDAIIYARTTELPRTIPSLVYDGAITPAAFGARSGDPEEMNLSSLSYYVANAGFGIRPAWVYETWWHKRMTLLLIPIVMIALCVPLATKFRRGGGIGIFFAVGVSLGFLFFIIDGVSVSLGELGFVPPWLAAWTPVLTFGALALSMGLRTEKV
jgi:lipopolysaccharide export system permease protein